MATEHPARVVVGVDDTLSGLQALRRAVAEARARGVQLRAVRAAILGPTGMSAMLPDQQRAEADAASQLVAKAFADTMGGLPRDVEVEILFVPGPPGPALLHQASHDDDLLVVGAGRRGLWRRRLGTSVARYCVARATCPVLVVPSPPLARSASPRALLRELRHDIDKLSNGPGPPR